MVLSNKKLKQKLRAAKAALLAQSEAQIHPSNDDNSKNPEEPSSTAQESLKSLLDAVAQKPPRLSKREKRGKKSLTLQENAENLKRDDGHGNEGKGEAESETVVEDKMKKKKRKRDDEDGLETEEVKTVPEKKKKRKRKRDDEHGLETEGKKVQEKKKKKRKRDDENGLDTEEVKKVTEKKKKKRKIKKKRKGKNEVDNADVKQSLENGDGGSKNENLEEAAKLGDRSEACTKVYVGGIPYYSTEDDIRSYFEVCGTVTEIDCMIFPESGKFRGIAIISFKTEAAAKRALALDGSDMGGLFLKVQPFKSTGVSKSSSFSPAIVEDYNRIYAGNLSWEITVDDLSSLFAGCNIASIRFGEDKETGEFRGYAHVDFSDSVSLKTALKLDQKIVCGRPVRISCAVPRKGSLDETQNPAKKEPVNKTEHPPEKNAADGDGVAAVSGKIRRRTCYECGERGHLSSSCPKKQAAEQTNLATS